MPLYLVLHRPTRSLRAWKACSTRDRALASRLSEARSSSGTDPLRRATCQRAEAAGALAVGMDLAAGYLEQKDFNHFFRIAETVALRIKNPKAIVQFELQK